MRGVPGARRGVVALLLIGLLLGAAGPALGTDEHDEDPASDPSASPASTPVLAPPSRAPASSRAPAPTPQPAVAPMPTSAPAATPTPTPSPSPVPAGVTPLSGSITFHGRGWGHGVGLSQYGARGRALAGQDAATILAHYYAGTTIAAIDPTTQIRVLVLNGWTASAASPLVLAGRWGPWTVDGISGVLPQDSELRLTPTVTTSSAGTTISWRAVVTSSTGTVLHDAASSGSFRARPANDDAVVEIWSKPSAYDTYRGVLSVVARTTTTPTVSVVNELPIDDYLRGVVPAEMPWTWPDEALRAQAIAARSYAAYRLRPGVSTYDVTEDTSSQVYRGVLGERSTTNAAVDATPGQVLRSGSAVANALFHSTGGGATEHNENVFVSSTGAKVAGVVSYLRGSSDRAPDGSAYDAAAPYATWKTGTYTVSQLSSWFGSDSRTNVGTLTGLDLSSRGVSGRLIKVTLHGSLGTKTVSGDVFRAVFNARRPSGDPLFRSNLFALEPIP